LDKYSSSAAQCGQGFSLKELKAACEASLTAAAARVKEALPSVLGPLLALAVPVLEQGYAEGAQQEASGLTPALFKLDMAVMEALVKVQSLCGGLNAEVLPLAQRVLAVQAGYLYAANTYQVLDHLSNARRAAATLEAALAAAGALSDEVPQQQVQQLQAALVAAAAPGEGRSEAASPSSSRAEVASEAAQAGTAGAAAHAGLKGEAGGDAAAAAATPATSTGSPASEAAASSSEPQAVIPPSLSPAATARQAAQADFVMVLQAAHRQASGAVKEAQAAAQRLATHGVAYSAQQLVAAQQALKSRRFCHPSRSLVGARAVTATALAPAAV
jgi:hypothetical protein